MLVLYRRVGESITLRLADDIDPATPVGEIINNGDITVSLNWIG